MRSLATVCGFLGAWSVAAGAVFQAVLELQAEESASDRIRELITTLAAPPPVSRWWWLLPPVGYVLLRRRRMEYRDLIVHAMSDEEYETQLRFINKAIGWMLVGLGALLIGTNETDQLVEQFQWSSAVFWLLLVVMVAAVAGHAVARVVITDRAVAGHQRAEHERAEPQRAERS